MKLTSTELVEKFSVEMARFRALDMRLTNQLVAVPKLKMPTFKIPGWSNLGCLNTLDIYLGLRRIWLVNKHPLQSDIFLIKKRFVVVGVVVTRDGYLSITCENPLDLENKIYLHSYDEEGALGCFIVFSQIAGVLKNKLIKKLDESYNKLEKDLERYKAAVEHMEKSLESIIPFIMIDKLGVD